MNLEALREKAAIFRRNKGYFIKYKLTAFLQGLYYGRVFAGFGRSSVIFKPIVIMNPGCIAIGERVYILHHARIEAIPRFGSQEFQPSVTIGDRTSIGQNFHLIATGNLTIGKDVLISGNVFISDCSHEYQTPGVPVLRQGLSVAHTEVGDNCYIGYGAVIQAGVVLGRQCVVGSNAVVLRGDYPDYSVLAGVPARVVKRYDPAVEEWRRCGRDGPTEDAQPSAAAWDRSARGENFMRRESL